MALKVHKILIYNYKRRYEKSRIARRRECLFLKLVGAHLQKSGMGEKFGGNKNKF